MNRISRILVVGILFLAGLADLASQAATGTWTGGAGAAWDTSYTNWTGVTGTPWDSSNGSNNTAYFNSAGATPSVSGTVYVDGITFGNTATIGGGTVTLAGSTPTLTMNADGTISAGLAGTNGFVKSGSGTLTVTGNYQGYTGDVVIIAGKLTLSRTLGQDTWHGGTVTINSGAVLDSANHIPFGYPGNVSLLSDIFVNGGTVTYHSPPGNTLQFRNLRMSGGLMDTLNSGAIYLIYGDVSIDAGTSAMIQSSGGTSSPGSCLLRTIGHPTVFNVGTDSTLVVSIPINADGWSGASKAVNKTGAGKLVFSGTNSYSDGTILSEGILAVSSHSNICGEASAITFNGGMLEITGTVMSNISSHAVTWDKGGIIISDSNNVFTFSDSVGGRCSVSNNGTVILHSLSNIAVSLSIRGAGSVIKTGTGVVTICAGQTYTGATVISSGTLRISANPAPTSAVVNGATTNIVWLDASDLHDNGTSPTNGEAVTVWANKAVSGAAAADFNLQTAGGVSFVTNSTVIKGHPAVHFDGTGLLATSTDVQAPVSIFYVGGMSGGGNQRLLGSANVNFLLGYWPGKMNCTYWGTIGNYVGTVSADLNPHLWVGTHGEGSGNFYSYRVDIGGSEVNYESGSGGSGPGQLQLGGAGTEKSKGDISEVLVYNSVLSDADRTSVEAYLHNKWIGSPPGYGLGGLSSNSFVYITSGAWLDLGGTTQRVARLYLDNQRMPGGTYGAVGSGAVQTYTTYFTGTGVLKVLDRSRGTVIVFR